MAHGDSRTAVDTWLAGVHFGQDMSRSGPVIAALIAHAIILDNLHPLRDSAQQGKLNEEQKTDLKAEIRQAQLKFTEWQWKLQDEMEKLVSFVKQPRVEEQEALVQLEKVLAIEREIKRAQVTLLVRIKNKLTPEQQAKLVKIRSKSGAMQ